MNTSLLTKVCIAAAGLALSAFANAASSDREPGWEAGAELIYQTSNDYDFAGGTRLTLDEDLGFAITFGYRFNPHVELQFALDWAETDYDASIVLANGSRTRATGSMESFTPRVNLVVNVLDRPITPFVMAGVGYSYIDTNIPNGLPQTGCWWDPWYGYICTTYQSTATEDVFTYQLGAGLRWDIGSSASLRLAYELHYVDSFETATGSTPSLDQIKLGFVYRY